MHITKLKKKSQFEKAVCLLGKMKLCVCTCLVTQSCPALFVTPWTVADQAPLSMGFSRQEYCSGLPFPFPRDLPDLGIKFRFPALTGGSLPLSHHGSPREF